MSVKDRTRIFRRKNSEGWKVNTVAPAGLKNVGKKLHRAWAGILVLSEGQQDHVTRAAFTGHCRTSRVMKYWLYVLLSRRFGMNSVIISILSYPIHLLFSGCILPAPTLVNLPNLSSVRFPSLEVWSPSPP
jgi:hypothetical protein